MRDKVRRNMRLFSFHDVDRLLMIKGWLDKGLSSAGVKEILHKTSEVETVKRKMAKLEKEISRKDLLQMLRKQWLTPTRPGEATLIQGELSRFCVIHFTY